MVFGQWQTSEYVAFGSSLDENKASNDIQTPLVVVANIIDNWIFEKFTIKWSAIFTCKILRALWSLRSRKITQTLFFFDKVSKILPLDVITGHCIIEHFVRSFLDEQESVQHV